MVEMIARISEIAANKIEALSKAAAEIKNKVSALDKPLNADVPEKAVKPERNQELHSLDRPLNAAEVGHIENHMAEDISRKIENMLTPGGIDALREKYPNLDRELTTIQKDLQTADTPAERISAMNRLDQTKGRALEAMLKESLGDLFEAVDEKQISVETPEGVTKPDLILSNARDNIKIGGTAVAKGDSLGAEVKCGSETYIRSQVEHIFTQVLGHGEHSVVIVTKEFDTMTDIAKEKLQTGLRERNSSICKLNITSAEVKNALLENVLSKMEIGRHI